LLILVTGFGAGCGESGERETRPIEVLFSVSRPSGLDFEVLALQAQNADHRFEGRSFETPHLFVMENATQPVRGMFRNLDPENPLTVELIFGTDLVSRQEIPPGACCTVEPGADCSSATETCEPIEAMPMRREIRFEVFSLSAVANIGFSATIGDQFATNITSCSLDGYVCTTPATFYIEDAQEVVSGVFTKFSNQDPTVVLQADLYVDDQLRDTDSGKGDLVVSYDL